MNYFSYYSEVEEHFVRRRRKNLLISPLDWALIQTWKEMGIPLHVVLRGIDRAFDLFEARPVKTRLVNSLFYCQQAVQECFAEHVQSRVGEAAEPFGRKPLFEQDEIRALLERFSQELFQAHERAGEMGMQELAGVFERALVRINDLQELAIGERNSEVDTLERDLQITDDWIAQSIQQALDPQTLQLWTTDAKKELKPYKKRVSAEMYEKILQNYLRKRARQHFNLSPLSLLGV